MNGRRQHTQCPGPHHPATDGSFRPSDGERGRGERDGRSLERGSRFPELERRRRRCGRFLELEGVLVGDSTDGVERQRRGAGAQPRGRKTATAWAHPRRASSLPGAAHGGGAADAGVAAARQSGRSLRSGVGVVAGHCGEWTRRGCRIWRRLPETRPVEREQAAGGGRIPHVAIVART
jgi:hypothetical protein